MSTWLVWCIHVPVCVVFRENQPQPLDLLLSYINEAVGQADKDFLAVERTVSQPEHAL